MRPRLALNYSGASPPPPPAGYSGGVALDRPGQGWGATSYCRGLRAGEGGNERSLYLPFELLYRVYSSGLKKSMARSRVGRTHVMSSRRSSERKEKKRKEKYLTGASTVRAQPLSANERRFVLPSPCTHAQQRKMANLRLHRPLTSSPSFPPLCP
jgi:hypothetical protein